MASSTPKTASTRKLKRVLIANRGEIAVRIIRTLRELGIETVAIYSDADQASLHRQLADFAVRLPGISSAETYLDMQKVIDAAVRAKADAIHPGYGFLSENTAFARAIENAGLVFIGPPPEAMEKLGNKVHARNLMEKAGVPVVPGAQAPLKDAAELGRYAKAIGYPLILKAANGGGGRGMRVVRQDSELADALAACTREAKAYFDSTDVFCERYIEDPRHIEFQVFCDKHGNGVHLFERDCSIQRRHQKLIEEAPSKFLSEKERQALGEKAVAAARAAGYHGAGTVEFICESPERAYFMEMNTRIQVEHPVTEMITGLDLIALQIKVAEGEPLPFTQKDLKINGWAFEARINAEDAARDFAPCPGLVETVALPGGPFVRVDTHIYPGYRIPDAYDSMIAKVIAWGETREIAARRLARALGELRIEGVQTTTAFQEAVLAHPEFQAGTFTTRFIEQYHDELQAALKGESPVVVRNLADDVTVDAFAAATAVLATEGTSRMKPLTETVAPSRWTNEAHREARE